MDRKWSISLFKGVLGNALYALLVLLWGGGVTYYSYISAQMGAALLKGFFASVLLIVATVAIRIWSAMPTRRQPVTTENIEELIKGWLFKYGLTLKNDPDEKAFFRLYVITEGNAKIFIGRRRGAFEEYLSLTADLKANATEEGMAEAATVDEKLQFVNELQLELSRANIGYKGLDYISGFSITKMIPITSRLGEDEFLDALFHTEATLNSALAIIRMAFLRLDKRLKSEASKEPQDETRIP